jgi:hypothetical protein
MQTLNYFPGQVAVIWLQTLDGYGTRADPPSLPTITRIIYPNFMLAAGYPQSMIRFDVGLYYTSFTLPTGGSSVGNYLVDTAWLDPDGDGYTYNQGFQIIVQAPFGNYGVSTIG